MRDLILEFLKKYCEVIPENPTEADIARLDVMIDDHITIEFEGITYYMPEDNSVWTPDDELIAEFLKECREV